MSHYLRLSFRLLDPVFHGRGDGGAPEWPPSPLRAFQALVAAAGQRWRKAQLFDDYARGPLTWLEGLGTPELVAPAGVLSSTAYRLYVPNNHADIVAAAWSGGDPLASIAEHRIEKDVRSTRLIGGDTVHYLWPITLDQTEYVRLLNEIARGVSHLGWGIDQAAASLSIVAADEVGRLLGERWEPADRGGTLLRVPQPAGPTTEGTLADLRRKHTDFVARLGPNGFRPVPPLRAFQVVSYHRATDPAGREWAAFRILSADPDDPRNPAFDTRRRCLDVAAWVRNATARICEGWPHGDITGFVLGHDAAETTKPLKGDRADERFMYLPLPSIERRGDRGEHVGSIRRVLVAAPSGFADRVEWLRRRLPGQELIDPDRGPVGMLTLLPTSDWVLRQYTAAARVWSTVTPVILPGYDDPDGLREKLRTNRDPEVKERLLLRLQHRGEELLRKAFRQAGLPPELVDSAALDWRAGGFWPGVDLAQRYCQPASQQWMPSYHVRVRFPGLVRGPLAVGAGRYRGLGVFAAECG